MADDAGLMTAVMGMAMANGGGVAWWMVDTFDDSG